MTSLYRPIPGTYHNEADGLDYVLGCQFWFSADDPAAVIIRCPQPRGEIRDWMFGRTLLAHGLHAGAGLALTHIEPCANGDHVKVTASFDDGPVTVTFPILPVQAFLVATMRMVPLGEASEDPAYAAELAAGFAELLDGPS